MSRPSITDIAQPHIVAEMQMMKERMDFMMNVLRGRVSSDLDDLVHRTNLPFTMFVTSQSAIKKKKKKVKIRFFFGFPRAKAPPNPTTHHTIIPSYLLFGQLILSLSFFSFFFFFCFLSYALLSTLILSTDTSTPLPASPPSFF